jgi:hypothetical protein
MSKKHSMGAELKEYIQTPTAIKERCSQIFELARNGGTHFILNLENLTRCAQFVADLTKERFPTLQIPPHSRWGHFDAGGINRISLLKSELTTLSAIEQARCLLDLVIVSVLLDAGAGATWQYIDSAHGTKIGRSEGLAIASLEMFKAGLFSETRDPKVTATGLDMLRLEDLAKAFQHSSKNNLEGLQGRFDLLKKLSHTMKSDERFEVAGLRRPSAIFDSVIKTAKDNSISALIIFSNVLDLLRPIWPAHPNAFGEALGDVWEHPAIKGKADNDHLLPFHKLSLWLTFSLFHGFETAGYVIKDIDELPGLAEYRNGGLFVDSEVLILKEPAESGPFEPSHKLIIEWRALTVVLLDLLAVEVQKLLGKSKTEFPLAAVLEGGTWAAGRNLAAKKRPGGNPPIAVVNKGDVF